MERLEALGVIEGYRAVIKAPRATKPIVVIAQITLADHGRSQAPFEDEMRANPAVLDCWLVSGTFDFLVRLACEDLDEYRRIANQAGKPAVPDREDRDDGRTAGDQAQRRVMRPAGKDRLRRDDPA